jgi:putative FmdB family regulatory protein
MPIYEYEHIEEACSAGKVFEVKQSLQENPLSHCPKCGQAVKKCLSLSNISSVKTNSELRDLGFTKLVRRDDGVYENVTRREGENRYMERGKPETMPDLSKTIKD